MGWQFTLAEFTGGPIMIVVLAVPFRLFLRTACCARPGSRPTGVAGSMEGHVLLVRFARTGGLAMLQMMGGSPGAGASHAHHGMDSGGLSGSGRGGGRAGHPHEGHEGHAR